MCFGLYNFENNGKKFNPKIQCKLHVLNIYFGMISVRFAFHGLLF
uniref:Uncharacterized protein n=1 Tax=Anguilla anguilla TaxID=7936 RepID=A0A0E9WPQ4_ANGAN